MAKKFGSLMAYLTGGTIAAVEAAVDKAAPAAGAGGEDAAAEGTFTGEQLEAAVEAAVTARDKRWNDVMSSDAAANDVDLARTYCADSRLEASDIIAKLEARAERDGGTGARGTGGVNLAEIAADKELKKDTGKPGQTASADGTGASGKDGDKPDRSDMRKDRAAARAARNAQVAGGVPANNAAAR